MTENLPPEELLQSVHQFPGSYQIKAIGVSANDFEGRVVAAAVEELATPSELGHSTRQTRGGRHVAVTLDITVQTPEQILAIYARLRQVEGLAMLL